MPISYKHRLIFVHIPKTAGTAIVHKSLKIPQRKANLFSRSPPVLQHLTPQQLRTHIPEEIWNTFHKVTAVRNPYDRLVSEYCWRRRHLRTRAEKTFLDFLRNAESIVATNRFDRPYEDHLIPQIRYFDNVAYDLVIRYEQLREAYVTLLELLNLDEQRFPLRKANVTRKVGVPYQQYYNDESKQIVQRMYKEDLDYFNYGFEDNEPKTS